MSCFDKLLAVKRQLALPGNDGKHDSSAASWFWGFVFRIAIKRL